MTTKPKRASGRGWQQILMPSNPLVHFISPLSVTEIVDILNGLDARNVLTAKVDKIVTPTAELYKFSISQRYTIRRQHAKNSLKTPLGDPFSREGEKVTQVVLVGILQGITNNQSLLTFDPGPQIMGCLIVAWALFLFFLAMMAPFTTSIKALLSILIFLLGVLAYQFIPMLVTPDAGFHFAPGNRLGDLMVTRLKVKRMPPRSAMPKQSSSAD